MKNIEKRSKVRRGARIGRSTSFCAKLSDDDCAQRTKNYVHDREPETERQQVKASRGNLCSATQNGEHCPRFNQRYDAASTKTPRPLASCQSMHHAVARLAVCCKLCFDKFRKSELMRGFKTSDLDLLCSHGVQIFLTARFAEITFATINQSTNQPTYL